jgi:hypothetical protein
VLTCLLVGLGLAFAFSERAEAGYGVQLDFRRLEPGQAFAEDRISGPFSFTVTQAVPPPVPTPPPTVEPTPVPTYTPPVSTKTSKSAATLPSADVFDRGGRSIKHARLTKLVYETMKGIGLPRTLAIACWNPLDWQSVVESEGGQTQDGDSVLLGFWLPWQPRWLHIAPNVCRDVQGLLSTRLLNERRAYAVTTVLHLASGPSGSGRILRSCRASTASRR